MICTYCPAPKETLCLRVNNVFLFFPTRRVNVTLKPLENEDEDVEKERERIERGEGTDDILRLKNLTKVSFKPNARRGETLWHKSSVFLYQKNLGDTFA